MLGWIIEKTVGVVRETYNGLEATAEYAYEEVTGIPEAIAKGWNEGLLDRTEEPIESDAVTPKPDPFSEN